MSHLKPWLTSNGLIESVKRKIMLPTSQNTFQSEDILAFINEELTIGIVPEVISFHEEYFVFIAEIPIEPTKTRYHIPDRAIGLKLRDLVWRDESGNIYEMTRISPDDKAYFQKSINYNNSIEKFFIESNDVVLAQSPQSLPAGHLLMSFYLKPNQLVRDSRAATITSFIKKVTVENAFLSTPGDRLNIGSTEFKISATNSGSITGFTADLSRTILTSVAHNLKTGYKVTITGASSSPSINGTYTVVKIDDDTFSIDKATVSGSAAGTWASPNLIILGGNSNITASTINNAINQEGTYSAATTGSDIVVSYSSILTDITSTNANGLYIDSTKQGIRFNAVPTTDFNSETGITESLFAENLHVDLIQTDGGHQNKAYDVLIPVGGFVSSTDIYFSSSQIPDTLVVGDYMCLANECIIPQIPSDLHTMLTERACARILAATGDMEGLGVTQAKINESSKAQGFLLDNRVEGAPIKINTNHTMLRFQKWTYRRRF